MKIKVTKRKILLLAYFSILLISSCQTNSTIIGYDSLTDRNDIYISDYQKIDLSPTKRYTDTFTTKDIKSLLYLNIVESSYTEKTPNVVFISDIPGILVTLQDKALLETPFSATFPNGEYKFLCSHPELIPKEITVNISSGNTEIIKVYLEPTLETQIRDLEFERSILYEQKRASHKGGFLTQVMRTSGFVIGGLGTAAIIGNYINKINLPSDSSSSALDAADNAMTISISVAATGLITGVIGQFLMPKSDAIDKKIEKKSNIIFQLRRQMENPENE